MLLKRRAIRGAFVGSFLVLASVAGRLDAATWTYVNDFSGTAPNTDFPSETAASGQSWTVTGGVYRHINTNTTGGGIPTSASIPITNATGEPIIMQTQFVVSTSGSVNAGFADTLGFGLFGLDPAFTGAAVGNAYYLADFNYAHGTVATAEGLLRILSLGDSAGFTAGPTGLADDNAGSTTLAVVPGNTYWLRLTTTYTGPTINMTLSLFDSTGSTQIGTSATASDTSPLTGTNFGYRNRTPIAGGTTTIDFDNFRIMPDPTTALAVLGLCGFLLRRRSKQNSRRSVA
jgi:hypothetical protein